MEDLTNLKRKVQAYQEMEGEIEVKEDVENLEAIVLSLGEEKSGIYEKVNKEVNRPLIKHNGSLVYQQLFNGKVMAMISYPVIEGYGQPKPPKTIAIYRPEEVKPPFLVRHMEEFMREVTDWEDYDLNFNITSISNHHRFDNTKTYSCSHVCRINFPERIKKLFLKFYRIKTFTIILESQFLEK